MGTGVASDTAKSVVQRGGTSQQAALGGLAAGAIDGALTYAGLKALGGINSVNGSFQEAFVSGLKQAGIMGSATYVNGVAQQVSDYLVNGGLSQYQLAVKAYQRQGMSEADARQKAQEDIVKNLVVNTGISMAVAFALAQGKLARSSVEGKATETPTEPLGLPSGETAVGAAGAEAPISGSPLAGAAAGVTSEAAIAPIRSEASPVETPPAATATIAPIANDFAMEVQSAGLEPEASRSVVTAYMAAGRSGDRVSAEKLRTVVTQAKAKLAEIDADLTATREDLRATLIPSYTAVKNAVKSGDVAAYQVAHEKYMAEVKAAQAKMDAAKLKAANASERARAGIVTAGSAVMRNVETARQKAAQTAVQQAASGSIMQAGSAPAAPEGGLTNGGAEQRVQLHQQVYAGSSGGDEQNRSQHPAFSNGGAVPQNAGIEQGGQGGQPYLQGSGSGEHKGPQVTFGSPPSERSAAMLKGHADRVERETGHRPVIQEVRDVPAKTASELQTVMDIAGSNVRDVYLFESNDDYGDALTDGKDISIKANSKQSTVFLLGHEIAHGNAQVERAGMDLIKKLPEEAVTQYKAYRDSHISTPDNADVKREMVADLFGRWMQEISDDSTASRSGTFGLDRGTIEQFYQAFANALAPEALEDVTETQALMRNLERAGDVEYARIGTDDQGRGIYRSSFPDGMMYREKQSYLLDLITNAWSKKPIKLFIDKDGVKQEITAKFDPAIAPRSDAMKIAYGNRNGSRRERSTTIDLGPDLYEIAENSTYSNTKQEFGKASEAHQGVKEWHYFTNDIVFQREENGKTISEPYTVTIDVKEKVNDQYFYSFSATKIKNPQDADSLRGSETLPARRPSGGERGTFNAHITPAISIRKTGENSNKNLEYSRISFDDEDNEQTEFYRLQDENSNLRAVTEALIKQFQRVPLSEISSAAVDNIAGRILKEYHSDYDQAKLASNLSTIYSLMGEVKDVPWDAISNMGLNLANDIISKASVVDTDAHDRYSDLRARLRETGISLSEKQKQEAAHMYGSFQDFRRKVWGNVKTTNNPNTSLDADWGELSEMYPELFPADAAEGDQVRYLVDALDKMKKRTINPYGDYPEAHAYDAFLSMFKAYYEEQGQKAEVLYGQGRKAEVKAEELSEAINKAARKEAIRIVKEQNIRKQERANNNPPRSVKVFREASELFRKKVKPREYYARGGTDFEVIKALRNMYAGNGLPQGGMLGDKDLAETNKNIDRYKQRPPIWYTASTPQRIFEEMGNWRDPSQPGARAKNYIEGEDLKNKYWGYVMDQGAKAMLWMQEKAKPIEKAFDGNQRHSTLAQMAGEDILTEGEASGALYDDKAMFVQSREGKFVFDKDGQLTAISSGSHTLVFDQNYRDRLKKAKADIEKLAANRDPKVSHEEHLRAIREAEQNALNTAKPVQIPGGLTIFESGNSIKVTTAGGDVLANIQNGKRPDMKAVTKLRDALQTFFDEVFPEQNGALVDNGYRPIPKRKHYFPHLGREVHGLQSIIDALHGEAEALPTEISGLTSTFAPGKPWTSHMLERMGSLTEYDAIKGFNKYVQAAADLIFYTPAIQRVRQLEKYIREMSIGGQNSAYAAWLHNWGNMLANKKADLDRSLEDMTGRAVYTISDKLTRAVGRGAVAGNFSAALSNMIGFLSSVPGLEQKQILPAILDTLRNGMAITQGKYDGFADKIPFLTRRFGSYESIIETQMERAKMMGAKVLGFAFQVADRFATEAAARAKYAELMGKGFTEEEAVRRTSDFLTKVFAERSKGMTPTLFNSKALKPLAQFQLEAFNQLWHFRDLGRQDIAEQVDEIIRKNNGKTDGIDWEATENAIKPRTAKNLWRIMYYMVLMSLWGALTRAIMGRDQTWNPAGIIADAIRSDKPLQSVAGDVADQMPFLSLVTGGGRIPMANSVSNVVTAAGGLFNPKSDKMDAIAELAKASLSFVPGGAQASKTIRGADSFAKGGAYSASGGLRYPIEQNIPNFAKTFLFGPSAAAPQGYDYQKDTLSASRTEKYTQMTDKGFDKMQAYNFLRAMDTDTKAGTLVSIATFDANSDGKPDFNQKQMAELAKILLPKDKSTKTIPQQAAEEAKKYVESKRKDKEATPEEKAAAEQLYQFWMNLMKKKEGAQ